MTHIEATYSAEDNKLRLYATSRLDSDTYAKVKAAGFKWAPKQELFVAPKWTPAREDLCIELAGEIEPEGSTMAERAALKAERLDGLASKAAARSNAYHATAAAISERFAGGQPILSGHHSERRARKDKERMENATRNAVKAHKAISYWQYRADGVEAHADYMNRPDVRARRIKTLLAELRDHQRDLNHAALALQVWEKIAPEKIATALGAGIATGSLAPFGTWSKVDKGEITPEEGKAAAVDNFNRILSSDYRRRWIDHILGRLGFEQSMLGDVKRYEGELTPVILQAFARAHGAHKPKATAHDESTFCLESSAPLPVHIGDGKALTLDFDGWRDLMQGVGYEVPAPKARRKSSKPAPMPLINPSKEEAERLMAMLMDDFKKSRHYVTDPAKHAQVRTITQAQYSANSGGSYSPFNTIEIDENGRRVWHSWRGKEGVPVCRIRVGRMPALYGPQDILHIEDKPTKPLPIKWEEALKNAA